MKNIILTLMATLPFYSCTAHGIEGLTHFRYSTSNGMVMHSGESYDIRLDDRGQVRIEIDRDKFNERIITTDYTQILSDLQDIVNRHKMYNYKGSYTPHFDVRDGDDWSFGLSYSEDRYVSASGYMAWPNGFGEAINEVSRYFDPWRIMPVKDGFISGKEAEEFLTNFNSKKDCEIVSFRYERYCYGKSKVYFVSRTESFTGFYYRGWGSNEGYNYYCADPQILAEFKKIEEDEHLNGFPQTPLDNENRKLDRWLIEIEYADGSKTEIVDYIPQNAYDYDRRIESSIDKLVEAELKSIRSKTPEQIGEHSITTFGPDGKPSRKINYDGNGRVLNGMDYSNPHMTF